MDLEKGGKVSICDFLKSGQKNKIKIPDYQRPYVWPDDMIETLFDDLQNFFEEYGKDSEYYIGNAIICLDNENNINLIDGQQRITSLTLLLRALYKTIEETPNNSVYFDTIKSLWKVEENDKPLKNNTNLVAGSDFIINFNIFKSIMEKGSAPEDDKTRYSLNYNYFEERIQELREKYENLDKAINYKNFIEFILYNVKITIITTKNVDEALNTFRVINSNGLPLADADLIKVEIMNRHGDRKNDFLSFWTQITNDAEENVKISKQGGQGIQSGIDVIFQAYMQYLHAHEEKAKEKFKDLITFFIKEHRIGDLDYEQMKSDLTAILDFYKIMFHKKSETNILGNVEWIKDENSEIRKIFDVLSYFPFRTWISPCIYYMKWNNQEDFSKKFLSFLKGYLATYTISYIQKPSEKTFSGLLPHLNSKIKSNPKVNFREIGYEYLQNNEFFSINNISNIINTPKNFKHKFVKILLAILAYFGDYQQRDLLPRDWQIEHIVPQRIKKNPNYQSFDSTYIERFGNKMPLEEAINKEVSDNFFSIKQEQYKKSNIGMAKLMGDPSIDQDNWENGAKISGTIWIRENQMVQKLHDILEKWIDCQ
ncbi:MAG: DUF262 domain-containing protein [Elusimicrobiales bacterium]|nr:DUF262 domain-containing protein [Elusimicrobiales bacterium]